MDEITLQTPVLIKLGSYAGKIKYCLIDTYFLPRLKAFQLTIEHIDAQLMVMANQCEGKEVESMPLHYLIWEDFHQYSVPDTHSLYHRNGITMDNRLENLLLLSNEWIFSPDPTPTSMSFYWNILSLLPVDMDELDYHSSHSPDTATLYECHHTPCTKLVTPLANEHVRCLACKRIKYCSQLCLAMDANIHSVLCNPPPSHDIDEFRSIDL